MVTTVGILPALGEKAILGVYEVKVSRKFEGRQGLGFEGKLHRNNKIVATVQQYGDGGGTYATFINADERQKFDEYVDLYTWTWGHEYGDEFPYNTETVLDLLAHENIEFKRMNASKKTFIKQNGEIYAYNLPIVKGATTLDRAFSKVVHQGDQFWNKEQWVTV